MKKEKHCEKCAQQIGAGVAISGCDYCGCHLKMETSYQTFPDCANPQGYCLNCASQKVLTEILAQAESMTTAKQIRHLIKEYLLK